MSERAVPSFVVTSVVQPLAGLLVKQPEQVYEQTPFKTLQHQEV